MYLRKANVRFEHVCWKLSDFVSFFLFVLTFTIKLSDGNFKPDWGIARFCDLRTMMLDLSMSHDTMSDFVSFFCVCTYFCHENEKFGFSISLKYFLNKKKWLEYVLWKDVWFCFTSLVCTCFCHETERFWFYKSLKYLTIFWPQKWCQIWICSIEECLILIHFPSVHLVLP